MKISTKGRYAVRMLLYLAEHGRDKYISLKEIAERENISKKYLEQIVSLLGGSGILRSNRGAQGGYMLSRAPEKYTVGEILRITEGSIAPVACLDDEPNLCDRKDDCKTLAVWKGLNRVISEYLDSITLRDILDKYSEHAGDNYVI